MDKPTILKSKSSATAGKNHCRRVASKDLFGLARRVEIEHENEIYLLQVTRHGKLILTK